MSTSQVERVWLSQTDRIRRFHEHAVLSMFIMIVAVGLAVVFSYVYCRSVEYGSFANGDDVSHIITLCVPIVSSGITLLAMIFWISFRAVCHRGAQQIAAFRVQRVFRLNLGGTTDLVSLIDNKGNAVELSKAVDKKRLSRTLELLEQYGHRFIQNNAKAEPAYQVDVSWKFQWLDGQWWTAKITATIERDEICACSASCASELHRKYANGFSPDKIQEALRHGLRSVSALDDEGRYKTGHLLLSQRIKGQREELTDRDYRLTGIKVKSVRPLPAAFNPD